MVGWLALIFLTCYTAIFYALWASVAWSICRRAVGVWRPIGLASAWVAIEWLRSAGALSFPWAQLCYTQYRFIPLIQICEVTGALGVSWVLVFVNATVAECLRSPQNRRSIRTVVGAFGLVLGLCILGIVRMRQLQDGPEIRVAMMQGNFNYRSAEDQTPAKFEVFRQLTQTAYQASERKPDLYVWAEEAAPGDAYHDPIARGLIAGISAQYHAAVLTGGRIVQGREEKEYNSALLFTPDALLPQRYDKVGVVPFGEYIPFRGIIPEAIQRNFQFFSTDLTPGKEIRPMPFEFGKFGKAMLGPFICYESVYPHYARMMTMNGADLLATPSHDQWFQSRSAMEQHLSIVVFRAVENRRDIARATTDGVSAAIDARGIILGEAPLYKESFLVRTLHLRSMITLYTRFGDWFAALCGAISVGLSIVTYHQGRKSRNRPN